MALRMNLLLLALLAFVAGSNAFAQSDLANDQTNSIDTLLQEMRDADSIQKIVAVIQEMTDKKIERHERLTVLAAIPEFLFSAGERIELAQVEISHPADFGIAVELVYLSGIDAKVAESRSFMTKKFFMRKTLDAAFLQSYASWSEDVKTGIISGTIEPGRSNNIPQTAQNRISHLAAAFAAGMTQNEYPSVLRWRDAWYKHIASMRIADAERDARQVVGADPIDDFIQYRKRRRRNLEISQIHRFSDSYSQFNTFFAKMSLLKGQSWRSCAKSASH